MNDRPIPHSERTHLDRIQETASFYRSQGVTVDEFHVEWALALAEAWRAATRSCGVLETDLAPVSYLNDEALDAVLAASRRIAHAEQERHRQPTFEEVRNIEPPGLF